jgi:hypothetical protein
LARREFKPFQKETLKILVARGEKRSEATERVELACQRHAEVRTDEALRVLVGRAATPRSSPVARCGLRRSADLKLPVGLGSLMADRVRR